jgi:hypothetical protein
MAIHWQGINSPVLGLLKVQMSWKGHKIWINLPLFLTSKKAEFLWPSQNIWTLISEQFCWFWYAVCHRNIVAVIMTMRAITYQWSRNFVSFSSFLLVVAIDKLYRDTKKISTNSQLYNPNLSALIIFTGRKLELCAIFLWHICFEKKRKKVRCT